MSTMSIPHLVSLLQAENTLRDTLATETSQLRADLAHAQQALADSSPLTRDMLIEVGMKIAEAKRELCDNWPDTHEKQMVYEGYTVDRKTTLSPVVHMANDLARATRDNERRPWTYKWHNPTLKKLIQAGTIPADLATLEEKYHLAITPPKEEED